MAREGLCIFIYVIVIRLHKSCANYNNHNYYYYYYEDDKDNNNTVRDDQAKDVDVEVNRH